MVFTSFESTVRDTYPDWLQYIVYQREQCPDTGRLHYQGYLECNRKVSFDDVKAFLGMRVHLEPRRGSARQARQYATKDASRISPPVEWGTISNQGRRTDIDDLYARIRAGATRLECFDEFSSAMVRYPKAFDAVRNLPIQGGDTWRDVRALVLSGPTRCGKSRSAFEAFPSAYRKTDDHWWSDYEGEKTTVWDDFRPWTVRLATLLKWLEGYPVRAQTKGGFVKLKYTQVILTTNLDPDLWYLKADEESRAALFSRLTVWRLQAGEPYEPLLTRLQAFFQ